ncbi:hypothetical protein AAG570_002756 [Ranatra chinensis]|uniref:Protein DPCD n=1 Tax=Ranatra chinensis TaxID=642074 RepID=A0ABD0Y4U7_9HEMI
MAEEYSTETNVLLRRALKTKSSILSKENWTVEVGDPEVQRTTVESIGIKETSDSPYVVRRVTKTSLEWRIRNLPYPVETYSVTANQQRCSIVVETTNKKYYKELKVPDLERVGLSPIQNNISFTHKYNTLIISYKKPEEVLDMERKVLQELKTVKTIKGGNLPCNPS